MSCLSALLATISYLVIFAKNVECRKPLAVYDDINCSKFDANYVEIMQCWLMTDASGQLTLNTILVLMQDLADITCRYRFIVEHNTRNVTYLSLNLDICNALGALFQNPVLALTTSELRRVSNFPLECPLKKDVMYVIDNFTINSKYIPTFTPVLKWTSNANFYTGKRAKKILQYDSNGRVIHNSGRS